MLVHSILVPRGLFPESLRNFSGPERVFFVFVVFAFKIEVSVIFKICNTMQLLVDEAKLIGLWAKNCAAMCQVLISKFHFGPEKFPGLSKNGPQGFSQSLGTRLPALILFFFGQEPRLESRERRRSNLLYFLHR